MKVNIKDKLETINKEHYDLLLGIGNVASSDKQTKAYLVGGMVRDLLLGFDNLDIDIVVDNNAHLLAEKLVKAFPNCAISAKHDRFHTAKLIFKIGNKNIPVDLASSREEKYEFPGALPTVSISDLQKDLIRRDFTINALAVSIMPDDFGEVVDLFHGLEDLKNKKIRTLHKESFIEDPTRMIRAVRFAAKLGFSIEEHTKSLLDISINSGQFDNLIEKVRGDRVKIEVRYLFNLPNIEEAIKTFFESGIYKLVSTQLKYKKETIKQAKDLIFLYRNEIERELEWLIYLSALILDIDLWGLSVKKENNLLENLQLSGKEIEIVIRGFQKFLEISGKESTLPKKQNNQLTIYKTLNDIRKESILITRILLEGQIHNTQLVDEYLNTTSKIKLSISGQDLIKTGISQGKQIGEILDKVLENKIQNPSMTKEEELKLALEIFKLINKK